MTQQLIVDVDNRTLQQKERPTFVDSDRMVLFWFDGDICKWFLISNFNKHHTITIYKRRPFFLLKRPIVNINN